MTSPNCYIRNFLTPIEIYVTLRQPESLQLYAASPKRVTKHFFTV